MPSLTLTRVLFVLLALQLVLGLQPPVARASAAAGGAALAASAERLGGSIASRSTGDRLVGDSGAAAGSSVADPCPLHSPHRSHDAVKHDCCKSSGCQCQCGGSPVLLGLTATRSEPATGGLPIAAAHSLPCARSELLFRPPIA